MEKMKKIINISCIFSLMISAISCSDDFLAKNIVDLYTLSDTLYLNNNQENVETSVQLPALTNSNYTVFMQPKWLSFNSMHGKVTGGSVSLSFSIAKGYFSSGYQTYYATIMLDVENVGLISFPVAYSNFGSPALQCSASSLNFESSGSQTFTISNTSEGILNWKITGIPDWLIISPSSGSLNNGYSTTITASLNFDNIVPGHDLPATLQINSNSTTGNFNIAVHVSAKAIIPAEVRQINGIVTDAEYDHESGIMAICTRSPNSLIIFNTNTNESNTVSLNKTPSCVGLSEDGHKAVVGYSLSSVSYINIDNLEITRDYTIDCSPYDIVLGNNGWCYITPTVDQWVYFRNLNLNSGELIIGKNGYTVYERTIIRKIPGKPYLVGSRLGLSPTGILIFDLSKGPTSDTISYYHESIFYFWISEDGTKLYGGCRKVYNLPEYDTEYHSFSPQVYGQIESELSNISALEECPVINSIFVNSSYFYFQSGYSSLIEQFNISNLNKIKTFNVSPVFVTENGIKTLYETSPRFIFVNKNGSTLYALKNLKENYNKDYWTIETFQL
jgi:hypothetical protein